MGERDPFSASGTPRVRFPRPLEVCRGRGPMGAGQIIPGCLTAAAVRTFKADDSEWNGGKYCKPPYISHTYYAFESHGTPLASPLEKGSDNGPSLSLGLARTRREYRDERFGRVGHYYCA